MAQANINIRMDETLKAQFEAFCADMGMTMTTAFVIYAKKAVREYRIPFEIGAEKPNEETAAAMVEINETLRTGSGKRFGSVDELMNLLEE